MARTNAVAVRAIFETEIKLLDPFINTANVLVTELLGNEGMTEERLKQIETYLSAHFASLRDPRFQSETVDGVSYTSQGQTGKGLESTFYGQTAMLLDSSGKLRGSEVVAITARFEMM